MVAQKLKAVTLAKVSQTLLLNLPLMIQLAHESRHLKAFAVQAVVQRRLQLRQLKLRRQLQLQ
jgi:hypothetical protein